MKNIAFASFLMLVLGCGGNNNPSSPVAVQDMGTVLAVAESESPKAATRLIFTPEPSGTLAFLIGRFPLIEDTAPQNALIRLESTAPGGKAAEARILVDETDLGRISVALSAKDLVGDSLFSDNEFRQLMTDCLQGNSRVRLRFELGESERVAEGRLGGFRLMPKSLAYGDIEILASAANQDGLIVDREQRRLTVRFLIKTGDARVTTASIRFGGKSATVRAYDRGEDRQEIFFSLDSPYGSDSTENGRAVLAAIGASAIHGAELTLHLDDETAIAFLIDQISKYPEDPLP